MAGLKDTVDFYWDPVCPWCWITSRWMMDVSRQKQIRVNWKSSRRAVGCNHHRRQNTGFL